MALTRIVVISDTHMRHEQLPMPKGDILVHCGDLTNAGSLAEINQFGLWLGQQDYEHKVVIAGNHDKLFERDVHNARQLLGDGFNGVVYLEDSWCSLRGLNFYGSPWTPSFGTGWAYQLTSDAHASERWERIEAARAALGHIDVLITHGPMRGVLDQTDDMTMVAGLLSKERVGCRQLRDTMRRVKPQLHLFGHIHESPGIQVAEGVCHVNAASCDLSYRVQQKPVVILV